MKRILLISAFTEPYSNSSSRVNTVYDLLSEHADVEIITSNYSHLYKQRHTPKGEVKRKATLIAVPQYRKNISIKRFYSHVVFSFKVRKMLKNLELAPDVVYFTMPCSLTAYLSAKHCRKHQVKIVIDIIDLWPESFIVLFSGKWLMRLLLSPWQWLSNRAYKIADKLYAASAKYAKHAAKKAEEKKPECIYLGTDMRRYEKLTAQSKVNIQKPHNELWICHGGSIGHSYDFDTLLEAYKIVYHTIQAPTRLIFVGHGVMERKILNFAEKNKLPIEVTGKLDYPDYLYSLSQCDIAFNSFRANTEVAFSYKFNDYLMAGLAIANNLTGETADIVEKYSIGFNFIEQGPGQLADKLITLLKDKEQLQILKTNSKKCAIEVFEKSVVYKKMIDYLLENGNATKKRSKSKC